MKTVTFYFDVVCPFAYLASTQVETRAARAGVSLEWKPILLGGVFRAIAAPDQPGAQMPAQKALLNVLDMQRWAAVYGVPLRLHPQHPRRSVEAMRLCHAVEGTDRIKLAHALYHAYFVEQRDISDRAVLAEVAQAIGRPDAVARIDDADIKDALRRATDEAVADGVFGVPGFVVPQPDGTRRLYWGQDRMHLVFGDEDPPAPPARGGGEVTFFYDFSSPFSYLGATQIERVAAERGARVHWRPFLLGALFRAIGTPDVPMATFSDAKRRYYSRDLVDWAAHWKVDFRWPSRFPMKSVSALRLALAVDDAARPALSLAIYRAYWAEDRDIADPAVLRQIAAAQGIAPDVVDAALRPDPAIKQALVAATDAAIAAGVCGAPSFLVGDQLFWGQDRLGLVARAL